VTERPWELIVAPTAVRGLARLPSKAAGAVVEFLVGPLRENPERVGHALRGDLEGLMSARRGPYRVVSELDPGSRQVHVLRIDHRADIYRPR
jgi:mRNA interferase RelE/StbE